MKFKSFKRMVAAATAAIQFAAFLPVVSAEDPESGFDFPLVYDAAEIPSPDYALDTAIPKETVNTYGIHFNEDPAGAIWSVQLKEDDYITERSLRFSTQTFAGSPKNLNLMTLNFAEDTVNNPPEFSDDGYVFESEFYVLNRDDGYVNLVLNGENENGKEREIAEIRFVPTDDNLTGRGGTAYAVDALGNKIGNEQSVILNSVSSETDPEQLYYVKVQVDLLNNKYSAWLMVRSSSTIEYSETEPTEENLLIDNADLNFKNISKFTGFSFNITQSEYGNGVWLKKAAVSEYAPEAISTEEPEITEAPEDGITLRMGVLSDFQYGRHSYEYDGNKFKKAVKQVIARAGGIDKLDVLMIPGDMTHNSYLDDYTAFVEDLEEVIPKGSHTKVMLLRGNHDAKEGNDPDTGKPRLDNFVNVLSQYDPEIVSPNGLYEVNGYQFVMVSQDTQKANDEPSTNSYIKTHNYLHSPDTVEWFEAAMNVAEDNSDGKPIFVGMHPNVKDTVYGSYIVNGTKAGAASESSYWGTNELYDALKDHSNAITFSGHSHYSISNERSIHQDEFTSLNTGSVNNLETEESWDESFQPKRYGNNESESTGYYIEVNTDQVVTIHRMDFLRGTEEELKELDEPWIVDVNNKESWQYTDDRDTAAPYFEDGSKVIVSDVTDTSCTVSFPQADDDDTQTANYKVEFINQSSGQTDKTVTLSSYYWLRGTDEYPETQSFKLSDFNSANDSSYYTLSPETTYKVKITALDTYYNESAPIESETFTTDKSEDVIVSAYFSDTMAMDNSQYAVNNSITDITNGKTDITYNPELKMYETSVSPSTVNAYSIKLPSDRRALMATSDGYTIECYVKQTAFTNSSNVVFGAAQSGGFDIETNTAGKLGVYVRNSDGWIANSSGAYPGNNTTLNTDEYYHITATVTGNETKVYINGELVDTVSKGGTIVFPQGTNMQDHYGVYLGADYKNANEEAQTPMTGSFVYGKIYKRALTDEEVAEEYNKLTARKSVEEIDELNRLLTETLPDKSAELGGDEIIDGFIKEGWLLMGKIDLSADEINAFKKQVDDYLNPPVVPTDEPTEDPTEEPTQEPTQAPTDEPTQAPTQAPTEEPTQAPTEAPTDEPSDNINLRFAVLSDFQYGRNAQDGSKTVSEKVKSAIEQVLEKSKDENGNIRLDAIVVPGDITHNSNSSEYQAFVNDLNSIPELKENNVKLMFLRGNHDAKSGKENTFITELSKYDPTLTQANNVYDINGYKFVLVSQDTYKYSDDKPEDYDYIHSSETIAWFENAMDEAAAESDGKPIFVAMHPGVKDTVFGSYPVTGFKNGKTAVSDYWGTTELYNGLKDHSNAITFSGHSHWTMANDLSIHQDEFTSLNTGAVNNMEIENCWDESYTPKRFNSSNEYESSGYYIEVSSDEKVTIHQMDFYREIEFGEPWVVDVNDKENWEYTSDRDKIAPYFESDAKITLSDISETSLRVNFTQAVDDETDVNNYIVKIVDTKSNETIKTATPSSYYWLDHAGEMPAENYWDFSGLPTDGTYKVVITAYDTFGNESQPLESEEFSMLKLDELFRLDTENAVYNLNESSEKILDLEKNGMTRDETVTWTPKIINDDVTMNMDAMQFSTRTGKTGNLVKLSFADSQVTASQPFNSGTYIIDSEFGVLHKSNGYVAYNIYGSNAAEDESKAVEIRFAGSSSGSGSVSAFDSSGSEIGNKLSAIVGHSEDHSWIAEYVSVRTIIDLDKQTYTIYCAPVKTGADGSYHTPAYTDATLLVKDAPLNASIDEISGVGFDISGSVFTYGVWLRSVSAYQEGAEIQAAAEINCDKDNAAAGETVSFTANITNYGDRTFDIYAASYDVNGVLISVSKISKTVSDNDSIAGEMTVPDNAGTIKLMLWDDGMISYDKKTISVN